MQISGRTSTESTGTGWSGSLSTGSEIAGSSGFGAQALERGTLLAEAELVELGQDRAMEAFGLATLLRNTSLRRVLEAKSSPCSLLV